MKIFFILINVLVTSVYVCQNSSCALKIYVFHTMQVVSKKWLLRQKWSFYNNTHWLVLDKLLIATHFSCINKTAIIFKGAIHILKTSHFINLVHLVSLIISHIFSSFQYLYCFLCLSCYLSINITIQRLNIQSKRESHCGTPKDCCLIMHRKIIILIQTDLFQFWQTHGVHS